MKTTLHVYDYDLNKPEHREPYAKLKATLQNETGRGHKMHSIKSDRNFNPEAGPVELETEHLFCNQWNTNKGRLFDWYEEAIFVNGHEKPLIKRGHYLDITLEMAAIRANTLKCRYTGMQFALADFPDESTRFNTTQQALGSPYLKESELFLVRLMPVCNEQSAPQLTESEKAYLLPLYIKAQTQTTAAQREKQLIEVKADYDKAVAIATTERDGFSWLLEHGVQLENCIFYSHTGKFGFGWRYGYTGEARLALLKALEKFPFPYDVK